MEITEILREMRSQVEATNCEFHDAVDAVVGKNADRLPVIQYLIVAGEELYGEGVGPITTERKLGRESVLRMFDRAIELAETDAVDLTPPLEIEIDREGMRKEKEVAHNLWSPKHLKEIISVDGHDVYFIYVSPDEAELRGTAAWRSCIDGIEYGQWYLLDDERTLTDDEYKEIRDVVIDSFKRTRDEILQETVTA